MFVSSSSVVDKEALQEYVLKKLRESRDRADYLINSSHGATFWNEFHQEILNQRDSDNYQGLVNVEGQINKLSMFIDTWISNAVDTKERFEFFIMTKAQEIGSGDEQKDYFWAMQIRHDQLVGLVRVLTSFLNHLESIVQNGAIKALRDPVILGLIDYSIEDQVYLEAEKVHVEREKLSKY